MHKHRWLQIYATININPAIGDQLGGKGNYIIYHIDGDRRNNDISNLRYLCPNCHSQTPTYCSGNNTGENSLKFRSYFEGLSNEDRIKYLENNSYIQIGHEWKIPPQTISRSLRKYGFDKKPPCISRKSSYYSSIPSKEELQSLVSTMALTQVCKKYGVSDNAIRKWCIKLGIPKSSFKYHHTNKDVKHYEGTYTYNAKSTTKETKSDT